MADLQWLLFQCDAVYMQLPPPIDQRSDSIKHFYWVLLRGIAVSSRPWRNGISGFEGVGVPANADSSLGAGGRLPLEGKEEWPVPVKKRRKAVGREEEGGGIATSGRTSVASLRRCQVRVA